MASGFVPIKYRDFYDIPRLVLVEPNALCVLLRGKDKQQGKLRDERNGTMIRLTQIGQDPSPRGSCGRGWDRTASAGDEAEPGNLRNQR